jgi:hypothetical protein
MSNFKRASTLKQGLGLDGLAAVVREQHQIVVGTAHGMLDAATAAGDALMAARNEISHGEWGRRLREDCVLNDRYVQLAENRRYGRQRDSVAALAPRRGALIIEYVPRPSFA